MDGVSLELQNKVIIVIILKKQTNPKQNSFLWSSFNIFFSTTVSFLPVTILTKDKAYHIILCFWIKVTLH